MTWFAIALFGAGELDASRALIGSTVLPMHVAVHGMEGMTGGVVGAEDLLGEYRSGSVGVFHVEHDWNAAEVAGRDRPSGDAMFHVERRGGSVGPESLRMDTHRWKWTAVRLWQTRNTRSTVSPA